MFHLEQISSFGQFTTFYLLIFFSIRVLEKIKKVLVLPEVQDIKNLERNLQKGN